MIIMNQPLFLISKLKDPFLGKKPADLRCGGTYNVWLLYRLERYRTVENGAFENIKNWRFYDQKTNSPFFFEFRFWAIIRLK